jgi:hypothetical protein
MNITRDQLTAQLARHGAAKLVCFCGDPRGLSFYRIKSRGTVLQLEFNEQIYRDREGRLRIEHIGHDYDRAEENAYTVGGLIESLEGGPNLPMQFGGTGDALSYTGLSEHGEWLSIDFEQTVTRAAGGALKVEELRDGRSVAEEFPVS